MRPTSKDEYISERTFLFLCLQKNIELIVLTNRIILNKVEIIFSFIIR